MKRKLLALVAAFGLVAASSFAQENLLFASNAVVPAEQPGVAGPMKVGTAPSGKKAIIVMPQEYGGDVCYRMRVEFTTPIKVRSVSKIHVDWEPLDENIKQAGKKEVMFSIFTLNREDNKLLRAGTLDMKHRGEDKKSIYQAASVEVPFNAVYDADTDCQKWTDTLFNESTKQIVAIEFYTTLGSSQTAKVTDGKGIAITAVYFE